VGRLGDMREIGEEVKRPWKRNREVYKYDVSSTGTEQPFPGARFQFLLHYGAEMCFAVGCCVGEGGNSFLQKAFGGGRKKLGSVGRTSTARHSFV